MTSNDKYNMLVLGISGSQKREIYPETYNLEYQEFKAIIDEIEYDGLFERGYWALGGFYIFTGLTFKGRSFLENNDRKEYHKIEKTEVNYNNSINIGGNNSGNIITGNNNTINSEFDKRFLELLNAISKSNLQDKENIINELNIKKSDEVALKQFLGNLLTRGAEVSSIVSAIGSLISL